MARILGKGGLKQKPELGCRGNKCGVTKNDLDDEARAAESDVGKIREKAGTGLFGKAMDTIEAHKAKRKRMMDEL